MQQGAVLRLSRGFSALLALALVLAMAAPVAAEEHEAEDSSAIAGTVTDEETGEPIEGAEVTAVSLEEETFTATTDADGSYQVDGLVAGSYSVTVEAEGYEPATVDDVEVLDDEVVEVDVVLQPVVVDEPDPGEWPDPETKEDCKNGGWQDYGFRNQGQCIRFVNTGKDSREPLPEPEAGAIAGAVTDEETGEPVEDAEITAVDLDGETVTATTDADGTYEVEDLAADSYSVTAEAEGYEPATADDVEVLDGETTEVDFALTAEAPPEEPEAGAIAGAVTDEETGEPVEDAEITAVDLDGETVTATTDADGTYEVEDLAAGSYSVTAEAEGYEPATVDEVEVLAEETTELHFALVVEVVDLPSPSFADLFIPIVADVVEIFPEAELNWSA